MKGLSAKIVEKLGIYQISKVEVTTDITLVI
jgi:hypothetical protein